MKEDILKFRKLCEILINEKSMSVNKICIESGITWPTMKKLREDDINDVHIMSSVLGQVQNYLHKHCDTIRFAGILNDESFIAKTERELGEQMIREQAEVILAGEHKLDFVKESESIKLAGAKVHERLEKEITKPLTVKETRKYIKKDKGNVSKAIDIKGSDIHEEAHEDNSGSISDVIKQKRRGLALDNPIRTGKDKNLEEIPIRSIVEIAIFLQMEAIRYRELAHHFEVAAKILTENR